MMIMTGVSAETSCDGGGQYDVHGGAAGQAEHKIGAPQLEADGDGHAETVTVPDHHAYEGFVTNRLSTVPHMARVASHQTMKNLKT